MTTTRSKGWQVESIDYETGRVTYTANHKWSVYLLTSGKRTYVGSTTDIIRRLRQHNGEIVGGARSTRGAKWQMVGYVYGFENRSDACRWEKLVKSRARGIGQRYNALVNVSEGICPTYRNRKQYEVPPGLILVTMIDEIERKGVTI